MKAETKRELFRHLLKDLGAGAKTNVGFGVLDEPHGWTEPAQYCYLVQEPETKPKHGTGAGR